MKEKKTILVTAYAINPYKGSEDGMGWNFVNQIARFNKVIAVTRKNNRPHIENYMREHPENTPLYENISFRYFDMPKWMLFWKKGPLLSLIYYYAWQFFLACSLRMKKLDFDIAHNLNFHNDWTPSFLWMLGKPFVWGPAGHHPRIPKEYLQPVYGRKEFFKDRFLWAIKKYFWHADIFLFITKRKAKKVLCMNSQPAKTLKLQHDKFEIVPSVASENVDVQRKNKSGQFVVLSVGRFVPLKGFDLTVKAFAGFYKNLPAEERKNTKLLLVGRGPYLGFLKKMIAEENITDAAEIIEWIPREEVKHIYASADVFLFPSHEGAGMVVAEAMSYGLPVVCLDNCGPGEFLHPDSTLRAEYRNYQDTILSLTEKLYSLKHNRELYDHEQQLSLLRFNQFLTWDKRGETFRKIYNSVA